MKNKEFHIKDELNDDFGNIELYQKDVSKAISKYNYKRENFFDCLFSNFLYWGIIHPILYLFCFFSGIKIEGKDNLRRYIKECKKNKKGGFIYANHVTNYDPFVYAAYVFKHKRVNIIGYANTLANPFLGDICRRAGYLPLPDSLDTTRNFLDAIKFYINKGEHVVIFPEAHIWPYYTKIRNFKNGSLKYPISNDTIAIAMVSTFRKRKFRKKPQIVIKVGNFYYPDKSLDFKENKNKLKEEVYSEMVRLSEEEKQYEYTKYIDETKIEEIEK